MVAWVKFPTPVPLAAQTVEQVRRRIPVFRPYLGLQLLGPPHIKTDQPQAPDTRTGWLRGGGGEPGGGGEDRVPLWHSGPKAVFQGMSEFRTQIAVPRAFFPHLLHLLGDIAANPGPNRHSVGHGVRRLS